MREADRITREAANLGVRRRHHGRLGEVLERYLSSQARRASPAYDLVELEQLWIAAAAHDPAIGLKLFALFTPQEWHVLAHLCLHCVDVLDAGSRWARYARMATDNDSLNVADTAQGGWMEIRLDAPERLARYMTEHYSVMILTQLSRGTGREVRPTRACFVHERPGHHAAYSQWFGEQVEFGCEASRLYFDPATLALPMLNHHPGILELLCCELDRRFARHQKFSGLAAKVATNVRRHLAQGNVPSLENQAEALHQSPRTLRRRLEEQGLTFRQLLDLVRAELEQQLELQGESRTEIALQLGYSDAAAYVHARKRWAS